MRNRRLYMLIAILTLAIGFATVSTVLYINGTTGIEGDTASFERDVVFFEPNGSEGTEVVLSDSGRTITFTTGELNSIGASATVNFKIKNYSQYDATLDTPALSCYFVNDFIENAKSEKLSDTNEYLSITPGTNLNGITIAAGGGVSAESSVTVTQIKSYAGTEDSNDPITIKFQCNINVTAGDSETPGIEKPPVVACSEENPTMHTETNYTWYDRDCNNEKTVGDEIAVGEEHFYVISNNGTTLNALAKYNLNAGNMCTSYSSCTPIENPTYKQDESMTGVVVNGSWSYGHGSLAFSNTNGWLYSNNDTIDIQAYDGPVKTAINAYKAILPEGIEVRLITKAEIEALVNDGATLSYGSIKNKADAKGVSWLYSTSYWSGSAHPDGPSYVWDVSSSGSFSSFPFDDDSVCGVRPVISLES